MKARASDWMSVHKLARIASENHAEEGIMGISAMEGMDFLTGQLVHIGRSYWTV